MIETEPEFDTNERDSWYALQEYEEATCPQCGRLKVVCHDIALDWYPQRDVCYATLSRRAAERKWEAKHRSAKPDPAYHSLPTDGTRIWVSTEDLTPDDGFLD